MPEPAAGSCLSASCLSGFAQISFMLVSSLLLSWSHGLIYILPPPFPRFLHPRREAELDKCLPATNMKVVCPFPFSPHPLHPEPRVAAPVRLPLSGLQHPRSEDCILSMGIPWFGFGSGFLRAQTHSRLPTSASPVLACISILDIQCWERLPGLSAG